MKHNKKNDVIIFDPAHQNYIKSYVLHDIDCCVYDPKKDIKFKYILLSLLCFPKIIINNFYILREVNFINFLKIIKLYFLSNAIAINILRLKPKVVLTYIDNSPIFHIVSRICKSIPFLGIQNGNRASYAFTEELIHPSHKYHIDEYFCISSKTKDLFSKYNQNDVGKYFFCGSLKEGIFFEKNYNEIISRKKKYDICILSEWLPDDHPMYKTTSWKNHKISFIRNCLFLSKFVEENNLSISVALRSSKKNEENFYKEYFQNKATFYHQSKDGFSSYNASTFSNVTIALSSFIASELIGAGLKLLYINPFGDINFAITKKDCDWYLSEPSYVHFSEKLSLLLSQKRSIFALNNSKDTSYINAFEHDMPMHKLLRERILSKIG